MFNETLVQHACCLVARAIWYVGRYTFHQRYGHAVTLEIERVNLIVIRGLCKKHQKFIFNKNINYVTHYLRISPPKHSLPDETNSGSGDLAVFSKHDVNNLSSITVCTLIFFTSWNRFKRKFSFWNKTTIARGLISRTGRARDHRHFFISQKFTN